MNSCPIGSWPCPECARVQIKGLLESVAERHNLPLPKLLMSLRLALGVNGPPIEAVIEVLGKEETVKRIDGFLK